MPNDQSQIKPTPVALVVCDNIYRDVGGKAALIGLFSNINAYHGFPVKVPRMGVFASVTGLRPGSHAKLEIVHGETDRCIVTASGPFPGQELNPLTVVDMQFVFNNVEFPEEGVYFVRFWGNDHLLLMRPLTVRDARKKGPKDAI